MQKNQTLEFTLEKLEKPVKMGGEDYVLLELDGKERDKYLNDLAGRIKTHPTTGKALGVTNFTNMQAELIASSIRKVVGGTYESVSLDTIQTWPAKVSSALFDAAKEISGLEDEEEAGKEAGKN